MPGIEDENPNCARTYASFRLVGEALDPAEVTARTGLTPDGVNDSRRGRVWWITSEERLATTSTERHLRFLLDRLEPQKSPLLALIDQYALAADFFCLWRSATGNGGPEVSPETLARITALRASLGFDFYDTGSATPRSG